MDLDSYRDSDGLVVERRIALRAKQLTRYGAWSNKMATRKWFADDGQTHFDTKAEADAHDERHEVLKQVTAIANRTPDEILKWFEGNFRVPTKRQPRKPREQSLPQAEPSPESAKAHESAVANNIDNVADVVKPNPKSGKGNTP